jgi:hypothetical protein
MTRQATDLSQAYIEHLNALEWTRAKMERLFNQQVIVRRDIERVYDGLSRRCNLA